MYMLTQHLHINTCTPTDTHWDTCSARALLCSTFYSYSYSLIKKYLVDISLEKVQNSVGVLSGFFFLIVTGVYDTGGGRLFMRRVSVFADQLKKNNQKHYYHFYT